MKKTYTENGNGSLELSVVLNMYLPCSYCQRSLYFLIKITWIEKNKNILTDTH